MGQDGFLLCIIGCIVHDIACKVVFVRRYDAAALFWPMPEALGAGFIPRFIDCFSFFLGKICLDKAVGASS